jgi:MoxR-like ATPase
MREPVMVNPAKQAMYYGKQTFYRDENEYIPKAKAILEAVGNLRLVGETGTGKSTIVSAICEEFGWELHQYQLSTETSRMDLLAQDILVPDGKGGTAVLPRLGVIAESILEPKDPSKPQVLFLDEFNYAQPAVLTIMNSLTDNRRNVRIPELAGTKWFPKGDPIVQRPKNHYVIIGMNPSEKTQYSGTISMNIAQLRRFESLNIKYLSKSAELEVIERTVGAENVDYLTIEPLLRLASWSRDQYMDERLSTPITTGNLINYAKLFKAGLDIKDIREIINAMYRDDERDRINKQLATLEQVKAQSQGA